jgi:antitoxin CptB
MTASSPAKVTGRRLSVKRRGRVFRAEVVQPMDDLPSRRRRAAYRATHRGTREMDITLGRFAESALPAMPAASLALFERLLALPDPELQEMIWHPERRTGGEFAELVAAVRAFHGLGEEGQ